MSVLHERAEALEKIGAGALADQALLKLIRLHVQKYDKHRFTPYFGDVWRGLVSPVLLCRGDTHCSTVSASHAGTPPPLLPALHMPHRDRCGDAPP
jgi:hypothetical protein